MDAIDRGADAADAGLLYDLDCDGIVSESPAVNSLVRLCRKARARIEALSGLLELRSGEIGSLSAHIEQLQQQVAGLERNHASWLLAHQSEVDNAHRVRLHAEARAEAAARDAARWNALVELWHASTEFRGTQDEDGRWSLTMMEAVEAAWTPGRWTGDTPDEAIDLLVVALASTAADRDPGDHTDACSIHDTVDPHCNCDGTALSAQRIRHEPPTEH